MKLLYQLLYFRAFENFENWEKVIIIFFDFSPGNLLIFKSRIHVKDRFSLNMRAKFHVNIFKND